MGALKVIFPLTYILMFIGSIALMSIPFTSGYYSKDLILEMGYNNRNIIAGFSYWLLTIGALYTVIYSLRLLIICFLNNYNGNKDNLIKAHESDFIIISTLILSSILSLILGYLLSDMLDYNNGILSTSIFILPEHINNTYLGGSLYPIIFIIIGIIIGLINIISNSLILKFKLTIGKIIYNTLSKKYYFDMIYNQFTIIIFKLAYITSIEIDKGILEIIGPNGINKILRSIGGILIIENTEIIFYGQLLILSIFTFITYFILL